MRFKGKGHGAGKTHVFQSLPQSLTASMKPHRYIVQRGAEACGDSLPRLAQDIGAPDDIGVVCLERRQQLIEAVAYYLVDLRVGRDCVERDPASGSVINEEWYKDGKQVNPPARPSTLAQDDSAPSPGLGSGCRSPSCGSPVRQSRITTILLNRAGGSKPAL